MKLRRCLYFGGRSAGSRSGNTYFARDLKRSCLADSILGPGFWAAVESVMPKMVPYTLGILRSLAQRLRWKTRGAAWDQRGSLLHTLKRGRSQVEVHHSLAILDLKCLEFGNSAIWTMSLVMAGKFPLANGQTHIDFPQSANG